MHAKLAACIGQVASYNFFSLDPTILCSCFVLHKGKERA